MKAYAEEKNEEVKLLERSIEDLEITVCTLEKKKGESATPVLLVSISPFSPMLSETTISCYFSQDGHHEGRSRTSKKAARKNRSGAAECQATIARCAILWESKKLLGRWNN